MNDQSIASFGLNCAIQLIVTGNDHRVYNRATAKIFLVVDVLYSKIYLLRLSFKIVGRFKFSMESNFR